MRVIVYLFALLISAAAALAAERKPLVVTSFLPIYSWTKAVAGDAVRVENLISGSAEPHHYSFSQSDVRKLSTANLVILNGLGLETWLPKWLGAAPDAKGKIFDVSASLPADQLIRSGSSANSHIWLDPRLAMIAVSNIAAALSRVAPESSAVFQSNAAAYAARLQKLDREIEAGLKGITNRAIVTYHDAFPYFARRYGLEVAGVVEEVAGINPTGKHLTALRQTMRQRNIRVICTGPESPMRVARQIAKDVGAKVIELDTLEAGKLRQESYENGMRENVDALRKALQ